MRRRSGLARKSSEDSRNKIIKIFSITAVLFLPPTRVATIYGRNFANMPELSWILDYPLALQLMVASGLSPYWYFKRKGWTIRTSQKGCDTVSPL